MGISYQLVEAVPNPPEWNDSLPAPRLPPRPERHDPRPRPEARRGSPMAACSADLHLEARGRLQDLDARTVHTD